ncbi:MAG: hypothetical protein FJW92_07065, partial [Actinobacteria bacterium]|nr:hypothetical protein [Actinomycetota bacterium]
MRAVPRPAAAITRQVADEMAQMDPPAGVRMLVGLLAWDMDAALGRAEALGLLVTVCAARCLLAPGVVDACGHRGAHPRGPRRL